MDIDLLKKHSLLLNHNKVAYPKINLEISNKFTEQNFNMDLYRTLKKYKNEIDKLKNPKIWDFAKKLTNDCEMIHVNSKNNSYNLGIANYDSISRSYFKLWEMIKDFDLIDFSKDNLAFCGLAEGPGGFVECMYNMRKKYSSSYMDDCICMTLKSYNNNIPGWKKSGRLFKENISMKIFYGKDGTGDIYKKYNIESLKDITSDNKIDLVTADGGFDFSVDYDKQEQMMHQLIFCEIVSAMCVLKKGGHFVLKIFDIFTNLTVDLLYFLTIFFKNVIITKPFTSRPANSEKYIVCKDFLGVSDEYIEKLLSIVNDWTILSQQNKKVVKIFDIKTPQEFKDSIKQYNFHVVAKQIKIILKTLVYINSNWNNKMINNIKQDQAILASYWCKKFDIPINIRSKFLKNNIEHYNYIPNFMNS